jgi:Dolichyl-phosphate-mannose-protein mannosyltransferase
VPLLDRLYIVCRECADACERRPLTVLFTAAPAVTLVLVGIGTFVLQRFPNSGDEYVYLYQAATLGEGRLSNAAPSFPEFFEFNYIAHDRGRAYGTFPPGWPLALVGAQSVGIPLWFLNPLLGTATLALMWAVGRVLYGPRIGPLAAATTAISSFFLFNAASFFSHTFCGALLLLAAYLVLRWPRSSVAYPILLGLSIGWAVVTRYFTGVIGGAAILGVLMRIHRGRGLRPIALVALGGLLWAVFLLAYNHALSGSPWRLTTTSLTFSLWFAPGFMLLGFDILATQLLQFILWTPAALLVAYVWYLSHGDPVARRTPLECLLAVTAVALIAYANRGGNQYGPRFYYEAFLFAVLFTTASLFREETLTQKDAAGRGLFAAMAISVMLSPILIAFHAHRTSTIITERKDIFTRVAAARLTDAVVFIGSRVGTERSMAALDLTRNGIDYSGHVLFALDHGAEENCRLEEDFPDRRLFVYRWNTAQRAGRLSELHCDAR